MLKRLLPLVLTLVVAGLPLVLDLCWLRCRALAASAEAGATSAVCHHAAAVSGASPGTADAPTNVETSVRGDAATYLGQPSHLCRHDDRAMAAERILSPLGEGHINVAFPRLLSTARVTIVGIGGRAPSTHRWPSTATVHGSSAIPIRI